MVTVERTPSGKPQLLHHGRPPWHAVLLVLAMMTLAVMHLPSTTDLDESVAKPATFVRRIFPQYMSVRMLCGVRALSAVFIIGMSLQSVLVSHQPGQATTFVVPYLPKSKLQRGQSVSLRGFYCQAPFTVWAWNLLGLSFAVNAYLTYASSLSSGLDPKPANVHPWLLRAGVVLFETAAPLTLLVSAVVTYAIWPRALEARNVEDPTRTLKTFRSLAYHNANVAFAMAEVALWGGLSVRRQDVSLSILFGCCYILFAWTIRNWWNPRAGPQFLYFFLDTTLGYTTTMALVVLCGVLMAFYGLFCLLQVTLDTYLGKSFLAHVLAWVLVCAAVGRVRD